MRWLVMTIAGVLGVGVPGGVSASAGATGGQAAPPPAGFARTPEDPLDVLYRPGLELNADAEPVVTVGLMEGQREVTLLSVDAPLTLRTREGGRPRVLERPPGQAVVLTLAGHAPGALSRWPVVAERPWGRHQDLRELAAVWAARGFQTRQVVVGSIFGLAGRVVDVRRVRLLLDGPGTPAWYRATAAEAAGHLGEAPSVHEARERRPQGRVVVSDPTGAPLARGDGLVTLEAPGGHLRIRQVEHGVGYAWHGREDRSYEGRVHVVVDDRGLSVVDALPLESLLRGLVPSETFASAPPAALRAQAVTARSEVLAKIGTRHLGEPSLLCASQHCAVFKGLGARVPSTDAAVRDTRGEVLVDQAGHVVDALYSAVCGGHTENNEVVWGTPPDPALRGRTDFPADGRWLKYGGGIGAADVDAWLDEDPPAWCARASMGAVNRVRWSRTFTAAQIDALTARLGVGRVRELIPRGRGVSGRLKALEVVGEDGRATVHRELAVRRLFDNLYSGMFVVDVARDAEGWPITFTFRGGGWGHGVGMCQVGAIGMAEAGRDYEDILGHYYNGAEVVRVYGDREASDGSQASQ